MMADSYLLKRDATRDMHLRSNISGVVVYSHTVNGGPTVICYYFLPVSSIAATDFFRKRLRDSDLDQIDRQSFIVNA